MTHRDAAWTTFVIGSDEFLVVRVPIRADALAADLTAAEADVCERLLRGESNTEIARHRRTSPRTVANQVANVFRKLGVQSRSELAALAAREEEGP